MSFGNFKLQISFSGSDELQFMSILIKLIIIYFNLSTKMTSLLSLSLSLSLSLCRPLPLTHKLLPDASKPFPTY